MSKEEKKATVINTFSVPIPCTELDLLKAEFDFLKATKTEDDKITGKEREKILSCLKPILDILEVDYDDDIFLCRPTPFYGFNLSARYFFIQAVIEWRFGKEGYVFGFSLNLMTVTEGCRIEVNTPNKEDEFFDSLKKSVDHALHSRRGELKEVAEYIKSSKDSIYEVVSPGPQINFDYYFDDIKSRMLEEGKIVGKEREDILNCMKPLIDIIDIDNDDIFLYTRHPFNGFNVLTRFFNLQAFVYGRLQTESEGYTFIIISEFEKLNDKQRLGRSGFAFNIDDFVKGDDFIKEFKKMVMHFVERKEEEIKEFAGLLK